MRHCGNGVGGEWGGWNRHRIRVSTQSWLRGRKFSCRSCWDLNSQPFDHEPGALTNKLSQLPCYIEHPSVSQHCENWTSTVPSCPMRWSRCSTEQSPSCQTLPAKECPVCMMGHMKVVTSSYNDRAAQCVESLCHPEKGNHLTLEVLNFGWISEYLGFINITLVINLSVT